MDGEGTILTPFLEAFFTLISCVFLIKKRCEIQEQMMFLFNVHLSDLHIFATYTSFGF